MAAITPITSTTAMAPVSTMSTMIQVEYARGWDHRLARPTTPLTEDEAHGCDDREEDYAALVWEPGAPQPIVVAVAWASERVDVQFADDPGRLRVGYRFRRVEPRTLFLSDVHCYFYPSEDPGLSCGECNRVEANRFDPDGLLTHEVADADTGETVTTKYQDIDVGKNWEPVPAFGDWLSITRYER